MTVSEKQQLVSQGLQDFIFVSKYARWIPELKRRETWNEAVNRVRDMHLQKYSFLDVESKAQIEWAFELVRDKRVLPSMRSMQFGGKAQLAHEARGYNCSVRHVDSIRAFAEVAYLMLCGCGTGLGLTKKYLGRLPNLVDEYDKTGSVIAYLVEDTIEGWADSLEALLMCYFKNNAYSGRKIIFDYSKIRRKGTALKTGGGRAPGYKPLKAAHDRIKKLLDRLIEEDGVKTIRPIHAYDILMYFADAVLSGGVRRTASSVVFDHDDEEMMNAKTYFKVDKMRESVDEETGQRHIRVWVKGHFHDVVLDASDDYTYKQLKEEKIISWYYIQPQRARSNNSVLLIRNKTTKEEFQDIIRRTRQFGEPGFVWANNTDTIYNPCYEIGFIPVTEDGECGTQFCNLTTINGNKVKTVDDFIECVRATAIIGTLQAGYTNFPYLSKVAKKLTEQEALLGMSITGILGSKELLLDEKVLGRGINSAIAINKDWADRLGIKPAARISAIKPEGTGSLAIGVNEPGAHGAHAYWFFKRIQVTKGDPIYEFFKAYNSHMCEESKWSANGTDDVITFPIAVPKTTVIKDDLTAIEHLNMILKLQQNWVIPGGRNNTKDVTNNVSCTVIVKDDEWTDVVEHIYTNRAYFSAVSMLAYEGDKIYAQAPFEKVLDEDDWTRYNYLLENYSPVDFTKLEEKADETTLVQEAACAGGACVV